MSFSSCLIHFSDIDIDFSLLYSKWMTFSCVRIADLRNFESLLKDLGLFVMYIFQRIIIQGELFPFCCVFVNLLWSRVYGRTCLSVCNSDAVNHVMRIILFC